MDKDARGTKREDPETGKKFYDLNKDPIVSPYTGKSYPRSFFEETVAVRHKAAAEVKEKPVAEEEEELEVVAEAAPDGPEIVSLEEADAEESGDDTDSENIPDVDGVDDDVEDLGEDDADVFLEEDEDDDDDLDFPVKDDTDDR
ncbi:TIGR02300 family protein [Devosia sp.]|uniref:TIGR02300 family protein n=1 Tax=Devosia sp. TaxID=1871048 RepID=UPI003A8D1E51